MRPADLFVVYLQHSVTKTNEKVNDEWEKIWEEAAVA
jgi:hypothetical protein